MVGMENNWIKPNELILLVRFTRNGKLSFLATCNLQKLTSWFPLPTLWRPYVIIVADIRKLYYNATLLHKAYTIMLWIMVLWCKLEACAFVHLKFFRNFYWDVCIRKTLFILKVSITFTTRNNIDLSSNNILWKHNHAA